MVDKALKFAAINDIIRGVCDVLATLWAIHFD